MILRPALKVLVESSSHSSLQFPATDLLIRRSAYSLHSCFPRSWCSPGICGLVRSRHSVLSVSSNCSFRLQNPSISSASGSSSTLDSKFCFKSLPYSQSSVPKGGVGGSVFSVSTMLQSAESLSLQSTVPEAESVNSESHDSKAGDETPKEDVIVQYIVIRKDLVLEQNWPLGSILSQGCHASVAAIWLHKDDPVTALYCRPENLDHMHKVCLEVKGEIQLRNLAQKLETGGIAHKLWIEQPENYATCLATKPYHKSQIASHFKKLKLCK